MRRLMLKSPYAGDIATNVDYARACLRDCLQRGEAPLASHLLYTQPDVLDDLDRGRAGARKSARGSLGARSQR